VPAREQNARRHPPPLPGHSQGASCPPDVRHPPAITTDFRPCDYSEQVGGYMAMGGYHSAQSTTLLYVLSAHCALFCALFPHYELSALPPLNAPAGLVALRAERTAHRPPGMQPPTCSTCPSACLIGVRSLSRYAARGSVRAPNALTDPPGIGR
jgi:hypothetical protein